MASSSDIEVAVRTAHAIEKAATEAAGAAAAAMSVEELKAVVALGSHPDSIVDSQTKWAAEKALHDKTGAWE